MIAQDQHILVGQAGGDARPFIRIGGDAFEWVVGNPAVQLRTVEVVAQRSFAGDRHAGGGCADAVRIGPVAVHHARSGSRPG
jgi:hypothetical protein